MTFDWDADRIEQLARLCVEGHSASDMARTIGTTRNAVIGKAKRLGLSLKPPIVARKGRPPGKVMLTPWVPPPRPPRPPPPPMDLPMQCSPCTIADLVDDACHWPLWTDGAPFHEKRYCGAMTIEGHVYCPFHTRIAYQPTKYRS
jgi:GcrA cell cycle regulator